MFALERMPAMASPENGRLEVSQRRFLRPGMSATCVAMAVRAAMVVSARRSLFMAAIACAGASMSASNSGGVFGG